MKNQRTIKRISSTKIETSEGIIFFYIYNIYNNNKLWKTAYNKEDNRIYNNTFFVYETEKGYNNAIKRAKKLHQQLKKTQQ